MSKITLHWQGVEPWYSNFLEWARSTHAKGIGNYPTFYGVETIGRVYYDQSRVDEAVRGGAAGADMVWQAVRGEVEANPQVVLWETPANEASIWDSGVAAGYVAFNQRLIANFHSAGKKIVVGAINTGWPRLPIEDGGAMCRLIAEACQGADGVSSHEYGWDAMDRGVGYHCLRYRNWYPWCAERYTMPPLFITECGIDRTVPPGPDFGHAGWRVVLDGDEDEYVRQLAWYESQLQADDYVRCATVFTSGPSGWYSFDLYEGVAMKLADEIRDATPPEPPEYPPIGDMAVGIDVSEWQGVIDWPAVAASGVRFAFIRASVCRSDGTVAKDARFDENWAGAKAAGILRGAYHYLHAAAWGQASFFVNAVGADRPELGYWGDLEDASLTSEKCSNFLVATDRNAGETCHVYTRASFIDRWGDVPWAAGRKLWVAHWTDGAAPTLPMAWDRWHFWQWSNDGSVPGIAGRVDLDRYAGTDDDLYTEYGGEPPVPPEPPVRYYDADGVERDEAWWRSIYGEGARVEAGDGDLRIVELHDSGVPTGMDFQVYGVPQNTQPMLRNGGSNPLEWKDGGYWEGLIWECYAPPDVGAYDLEVPGGDSLRNFGWLCQTEHRHPKKIVYAAGTPPPPETYTLTVEVVGQGEVVVTPPGPYELGATVTLTAYPESGWVFVGWSGDLTGTVNPAELLMDGDKTVTATFEESTPDPVQALIEEARALLALADAKLVEALGLLP